MNKIFFTIIIFSLLPNISFCQTDPGIGDAELVLVNQSEFATNGNGRAILVKIYPVGAIFNGQKKYSLSAIAPIRNIPRTPFDEKIIGYQTILDKEIEGEVDWYARGNFDDNLTIITPSDSKFSLGMGRYKIEFYELHHGGNANNPLNYDIVAGYCYLDWSDSRLYLGSPSFPGTIDIHIEYFDHNDIRFHWRSDTNYYPVQLVNYDIRIWEQYGSGFPITAQVKGPFFSDDSSPAYFNYPIDARDSGAVNHISSNEFYLDIQIINQGISVKPNNSLKFINSSLTIDNNINFTLHPTAGISFTGTGSGLISKNNSILNFPQNYLLSISSGGRIYSKGSTFTSSTIWNGIKLENSGYDTIINCTFSNAKTSIAITDNGFANHPGKVIRKNVFNISENNGRGIDVRNQNKIHIDSNTFNFSNSNTTVGIFFRNSYSPEGEGASSFNYSLNITNNIFDNGYVPILISCLTSSRTPFYIYGNTFWGDNSYSITGLKITGDIRTNKFDVNNYKRCIGLWNSNPNILANNFNSVATNMYLNYSYPSLSPYPNSSNQLVWTGGKNSFYTELNENIFLENSFPYLNKGKNTFTYFDSTHLFGSMPYSTTLYNMAFNCWNGNNDVPDYFLYQYLNDTTIQNVAANYTPTFCDEDLTPVSIDVTDRGSGIFDTTITTVNFTSDSTAVDEALLSQARTSNKNENFTDAIANYKGLIDNFTSSEYIYASLYEIYDNYSALDTSADQTVIDVLYGDLRQYLQNKISSEIYAEDINSLAFDIILMCEVRMKNYEECLTGYEFIALYHPNAEQRMLASWDYEDIQAMIGGSGGGVKDLGLGISDLEFEERYEINELKRMDQLL